MSEGLASWLSHNILRICDPADTLDFYEHRLGMSVVATREFATQSRFYLAFDASSEPLLDNAARLSPTVLELCHDHVTQPGGGGYEYSRDDGYWKVGVTLPDVDLARHRLQRNGIEVSEARQFRDIGYLCHLRDPEGYHIELLQHRFAQNHRPATADDRYVLGSMPTLGQITLRIKDPTTSLAFYQECLGMRLLSRQVVETHSFTLYFFAFTDERPPVAELDSVENREWLWQRPYTTLELQHRWGRERTDFQYVKHHDTTTGFWGLGFITSNLDALVEKLSPVTKVHVYDDSDLPTRAAIVTDPDGYRLRFLEAPGSSSRSAL